MDCAGIVLVFWLVCFHIQIQRGLAQSNISSSSKTSRTRFINETLSESCKKLGYCLESKNYPRELAKKLIYEIKQADMSLDSDTALFETRMASETTSPCEHMTTSVTITPLVVKDSIDNEWYYAINSPENPIQQYNVNVCQNKDTSSGEEDNECRQIILDSNYKSQCVQKYVTRTIMVIKGDKSVSVSTDIPCCCTCVALNK